MDDQDQDEIEKSKNHTSLPETQGELKMHSKLIQIRTLILAMLMVMALSACAGSSDLPAKTVELYYQALVEKDQVQLINHVCADYESQALLEFDSFTSVETTLTNLTCQTVSQEGDRAEVTCDGAISASYDGEAREFSLAGATYLVVKEGGEWRLCGYQ